MKNEQHIIDTIRKAKLKLFTNQLIFFGMSVNKFTWEVEECSPNIEGYVKFNLEDMSKLESGTIYLNEHYLSKPDYTFDNLAFLLSHELLHILNKHGARKGDRIHEIWCVACDHVVEVFLKTMSSIFKPHNNQYNIIPDLEHQLPNCTTEQAYNWIIKNQNKVKISKPIGLEIDVQDSSGNTIFTVSSSMGGSAQGDENPAQNILIDQLVAEARAIFETLKDKGALAGNLVTYLDKILKVDIPWETLVEKSIKTNTIIKPDERCWRNLNKYYVPHNLTLPGYASIEEPEGVGTLIVGVDSSGSITDRNLKKFSGIIESSMKYFKTIIVLVHDVGLHQTEIFTKENIYTFYKFISEIGYHGRGGTSHRELFNEIQKKYWDESKDDLSMVISLTDMASDIQYCYKDFEWIKNNLPLVFIITSDGSYSTFDDSFGNITQIKINN